MRALVVGSGAVGLRTAVELIRRNIPVTLRSPVPPLDPTVCSMGAGGLWMPFKCDDVRTDRWALETLDELWQIVVQQQQQQSHQSQSQPPLVEIMTAIMLHNNNEHVTSETTDTKVTYPDIDKLPSWTHDPRLKFQQLTVEMLWWQNSVNKLRIPPLQELKDAGYWHAWMFQTPIVDAPKMLEHLLQEVMEHPMTDVDVETGDYYESVQHLRDVAQSLNCDTVINCSGLGSRSLCKDDNIRGGRGVLLQVERQDCPRRDALQGLEHDAVLLTENPPWAPDEQEPCYMIPRGDIIAVGGSYSETDPHPTLRDTERTRLLQNGQFMGIDMTKATIRSEWTGFRPYHSIVRCCEEDDNDNDNNGNVRVIHNYGHGGSGWTTNVGTAKEVVNILLNKQKS